MTEITYVEIDGTTHRVEVPAGTSVMQGAVNYMVPGIEGDCGGLCACGTCHVYIPETWADRCGEKGELESAMLEFAFGVEENSRLSCQIVVSDELHGLTVHMPERQY